MSPARLSLLTAMVLVAFAGNSVLNRLAVGGGAIDPLWFALIRALAAAVFLAGLVVLRGGSAGLMPARGQLAARCGAVLGLGTYLICFSLAYLQIDAGVGALVLFAFVHLSMLVGGLARGEGVPLRALLGAGVAMLGLIWLSWPAEAPGPGAVPPVSVGLMAAAGGAWGLYSLIGRHSTAPLRDTAANFLWVVPVCALALWLAGTRPLAEIRPEGIALAVLAGALTSGLGYALWYAVLPRLGSATAGLVQLAVPILAICGGVAILGETIGWRGIAASGVILGGIALGLGAFQRRIRSSGS